MNAFERVMIAVPYAVGMFTLVRGASLAVAEWLWVSEEPADPVSPFALPDRGLDQQDGETPNVADAHRALSVECPVCGAAIGVPCWENDIPFDGVQVHVVRESWAGNRTRDPVEFGAAAARAFSDRHVVQFYFASADIIAHPDGELPEDCDIPAMIERMKLPNGQMQVQGLYVESAGGTTFERYP